MNSDQFRKILLSHQGVSEGLHNGHVDFRLHGKVIASLGSPDNSYGMLKLTAEQQQAAIATNNKAFQPCVGAFGARGYTNVKLSQLSAKALSPWVRCAVENVTVS